MLAKEWGHTSKITIFFLTLVISLKNVTYVAKNFDEKIYKGLYL